MARSSGKGLMGSHPKILRRFALTLSFDLPYLTLIQFPATSWLPYLEVNAMSFAKIRDAIHRQLTGPIVAGLFLSLLSPPMSWAQTSRQSRPLRVAYLSTSSTMASVWMAKESGAFAREGLDIEVLSMQSTSAIPALLANEIDVVQVSAAPVLTAALRGIDVTFIAGLLNTMIWDFYVRPEIKNVEQLKGKIVGTDRPATPVAYGTLVALKKLGLTAKDVQLRPLGSSPQIVAAFYANQIAGGVGSPP
ncbi:MAG TPA: ABC transporter substrate-binding protein, partial [Candidatus Binatia bacterium]